MSIAIEKKRGPTHLYQNPGSSEEEGVQADKTIGDGQGESVHDSEVQLFCRRM